MTDPITLVRTVFDEVINKGNMDVLDDVFAEDFIDHGPFGDMPGRATFKEFVLRWRAAVPDVHCEVLHPFTSGDLVGWLVRTTGTHTGEGLGFAPTGRAFTTDSANLCRLRDGVVVEHWAEQGMLSMLVQLGVLPAPGIAPVST